MKRKLSIAVALLAVLIVGGLLLCQERDKGQAYWIAKANELMRNNFDLSRQTLGGQFRQTEVIPFVSWEGRGWNTLSFKKEIGLLSMNLSKCIGRGNQSAI